MQRFLVGIWNLWRIDRLKPRVARHQPVRDRLTLESLESRLTPSTIQANAILSGSVTGAGGGVSGVHLVLTGTTTTSRQVSYSAVTDGNGDYSFTQLLPGTYKLTRPSLSNFLDAQAVTKAYTLDQGETLGDQNLGVTGIEAQFVGLNDFLSYTATVPQQYQPAGSGVTLGYTLDSSLLLGATEVATSNSPPINLASYFSDPDATNSTVITFTTTLPGSAPSTFQSFDVDLYDKDDPATVANFLDYIDSGDFADSLFNRISSLTQNTGSTPGFVGTPADVLQGGAVNFSATGSTVNDFTSLTPFASIPNESNGTLHPNAQYTIAMARGTGVDSATSQYFFNLVNNSTALGDSTDANGQGYAVFGEVSAATQSAFSTYAGSFISNNQSANTVIPSTVASNFANLPIVSTGFTPPDGTTITYSAAGPGLGASTSDLAGISSITVSTAGTGKLTYSNLTSSNPKAITATLGQNTLDSTLSADQLQLKAATGAVAGAQSTITFDVTDAKGEMTQHSFVATVS